MNILFLMKVFEVGGQEVVTSVLADTFVKRGHKVTLVSFLSPSESIINRLNSDIKVYTIGDFKYSTNNVTKLRKTLIKENIDIVINQWGLPYIPIMVLNKAKRGLNIKVISVYHNDPLTNARLKDVEIALLQTINPLKKMVLKTKWQAFDFVTSMSMRYVYNHSDKYMVLSPSYVDHFRKFTGIKNPTKLLVQTNPITIDAQGFVYTTYKKEKEIIYVGRIDYNQKRVSRIIDVWSLLENKFPDWKLTIVGDGIERKNIEKQVDDLNLKRVSFEGFQQPIEYYKRASLLILTSEYEGFPLVLAECMSFGVVPVVYASYAAVYDIIEDGKDGIIIDLDKDGFKAQEMADRMTVVMDNDRLRDTIALNAVEKSKNYSINSIYQSWEEVFNSL